MIQPNVITYSKRSSNIKTRKSISVINTPPHTPSDDVNKGTIDFIRNQPKPNEISKHTASQYKEDIKQMVSLMGAYCSPKSISKIFARIKEIHETLNNKKPPEIRGWIRHLTNIHPEVDTRIKALGFWKMPYSEVIGTNTILYYPSPGSIDITNWAKKPKITHNQIEWFTTPWPSPQYIRESIRQKIDTPAATEYIQNAGFITTKYLRRNLIWESLITTAPETGAETKQKRPISPEVPEINHGASLNNDWYHQKFRIMDGAKLDKNAGRSDAICHLKSGGYFVHLLVNHLTPIKEGQLAQNTITRFEAPIGVEETFPRRKVLKADFDNSGQKVLPSAPRVIDDMLKPEIIEGE